MIKFVCPHCQKALKVKDEMAGKKARCPGCKQVITITAEASPPTADVEALAAAALAEQPAKQDTAPAEPTTITFNCPNCEEKISMPADLGGKNAPCPECRRIIKVPMPARKATNKDWRQAEARGPLGARRDVEPPPEGTWTGTTTRVSSQALVEAEAIPVKREAITVRGWVVRIGLGVLAVGLIVGGILGLVHHRAATRQTRALDLALDFVPEGKGKTTPLTPTGAAEVCRAASVYYFRAGKLDMAGKYHGRARTELLNPRATPTERDTLLIELGLAQVDMGGSKEEVAGGTRVAWADVQKNLQQVLQPINAPAGREEAVREASRQLVAAKQGPIAVSVVNRIARENEGPQLLALAGLEMAQGGDRQAADEVARQALLPYELKPAAGGKPANVARPPESPALIALLLVLDRGPEAAKALAGPPKQGPDFDETARVGYAHGWALVGKLADARALAALPGNPLRRFEALAEVALAVGEKSPTDARPDVEAAVNVLQKELTGGKGVSPWLILRLVRLAVQSGVNEKVVQDLIGTFTDTDLVRRAQLAVVEARLEGSKQPDLTALTQAAGQQPPNELVLEALARQNARLGQEADVMSAIASWKPETVRPFGYIGVALGLQDSGK